VKYFECGKTGVHDLEEYEMGVTRRPRFAVVCLAGSWGE
jgi:hypothetical protein